MEKYFYNAKGINFNAIMCLATYFILTLHNFAELHNIYYTH